MPSPTVGIPLACLFVAAASLAAAADDQPRGFELRVESELFADGGSEPVARSLTLFKGLVAWDFLELAEPAADGEAAMRLAEIVLHDPARDRVVVIDPRRDLKTQVDTIRLERLSVSLAKWARSADDRLVRWAGGPDFGAGMTEKDDTVELVGPRVRYAVAFDEAPSSEAAGRYREFADTAILLKARRPAPLPAAGAQPADRGERGDPRGGVAGDRSRAGPGRRPAEPAAMRAQVPSAAAGRGPRADRGGRGPGGLRRRGRRGRLRRHRAAGRGVAAAGPASQPARRDSSAPFRGPARRSMLPTAHIFPDPSTRMHELLVDAARDREGDRSGAVGAGGVRSRQSPRRSR